MCSLISIDEARVVILVILRAAAAPNLTKDRAQTNQDDVAEGIKDTESLFARNEAITFDEAAHVYYVNGRRISTSVTTFIHKFFEEFDAPRICRMMVRGRAFMSKSEHSQYKELPIWCNYAGERLDSWQEGARLIPDEDAVVQCITDKWKRGGSDAAERGTRMHANIEAYLKGESVADDSREFAYFLRYNEKMRRAGYVPFRMETRVYDENLSLAGSVDMMWTRPEYLKERPLRVMVVDWKRSKEIKRAAYRNKRGKGCCSTIPDCNYYHYSLQLNIYRHLLELHYGVEVEGMALVVLYPENNDYIEIEVDHIDVSAMLEEARIERA